MCRYYYKIADIVIRVNCDFIYDPSKSYICDYLVDPGKFDYDFYFQKTDDVCQYIPDNMQEVKQVGKFLYCMDDNGEEYCLHFTKGIVFGVTIQQECQGICYYADESILAHEVNHGYYLENYLCLEKILLRFQAMVLHSCHIQYRNQAILFTAPSETGKSTQGDLWVRNFKAEVINGDRTIIRKVNRQWFAYGAPFCGTSGIHLNRREPLSAVIIIRQGKENRVSSIGAFEASKLLFSEMTVHNWDAGFVGQTFSWIAELLNDIPVYFYLCNKEDEAASCLKDFLQQEGVIHD